MTEEQYRDEIVEVRAAITSIRDNLSNLVAAESARSATCNAHFLRTANVENTLFGSQGLKDRVTTIESAASKTIQLYATWLAALAAVSALAGVIVMLVQK